LHEIYLKKKVHAIALSIPPIPLETGIYTALILVQSVYFLLK
jgi:hypothetical protein